MDLIRAGRAILLSGGRVPPHLWFILTDPEPNDGRVVAVMLVTARPHTDKTVVLVPGDHPFIRHESNVDYGAARFLPQGRLNDALASGRWHLQADMSATLLRRVREGLLTSQRVIHDIADHCRERFPASPES